MNMKGINMEPHQSWKYLMLLFVLVGFTACKPSQPTIPPGTIEIPTSTHTPAPTASPSPTVPPPPAEPADIIFHNGVVITIEEAQPLAEAVAIRNGLIQVVGTNAEALALQGPGTSVVDLQGKTMMPGFIEGHTHFIINALEDGKPLPEIMDTLLSFGLTSVTEMHGHREYIESMLQAEQDGELRVRVNIFSDYNYGYLENRQTIIDPAWYLDHAPVLDPTRMLRLPGVKIFVDGAGVPGRGCAFKSFPFPENITDIWPNVWDTCGSEYGDLYLNEEQLTDAIQSIQDQGYRAAFHVMGDAAIDHVLNALETVLNGESNTLYRHQIQHNSILRPDMLERYVQMDLLASVRGAFNTCDAEEYVAMFGEDHYEWAANRFALPGLIAHAFNEGDFGRGDPYDVTRANPLNPIASLYGLVTHQQLRSDGSICIPPEWIAKHQISVERALEMLTIEPAYAVSMEDYTGSIKPGKYADLIILSGNPLAIDPNDLKNLKVWMTMVGGSVEYCAAGYEAFCPQAQATAPASAADLPTSGNLALGASIRASHSLSSEPAGRAVDGNDSTSWNSGDFPPQWIELDLGAPAAITEIRLLVTQDPNGNTQHRILLGSDAGNLSEMYQFNQTTQTGTWLVFRPEEAIENIRIVRIETLSSPSWVGWVEIQVFGRR